MVGIPGSRDPWGRTPWLLLKNRCVSRFCSVLEKFLLLTQVRIIIQNYSGKKALLSVKRTELLIPGKMEQNHFSLFLPISSVQSLSRVRLFVTPWIAALQASLSITNSRSLLKLMSIKLVMPSSHLILCRPLLLPTIPPRIRVFSMSQLFTWGGQSIGVSDLASVLPMNTRTDLLQDGLVGSPCSPRDSQESSPTPQFKIINSSALSFLRSPTLTSIHDHWKNHSLD